VPVCVSVLVSMDREIPKSISRGPSSASSTFDGFRSRWTMPAACIALRPYAIPVKRKKSSRMRHHGSDSARVRIIHQILAHICAIAS
jgi:hypothetical protein